MQNCISKEHLLFLSSICLHLGTDVLAILSFTNLKTLTSLEFRLSNMYMLKQMVPTGLHGRKIISVLNIYTSITVFNF